MSKSRKSLYFLFPLVVIIWGLAIYRMFSSFDSDPEIIVDSYKQKFKKFSIKKKDTFNLLPLTRDPFLGFSYQIIKPGKRKKINQTEFPWPHINYIGLVSNQDSSNKVHILEINGLQVLLKKGESKEGLKVISSTDKSVRIAFKGRYKSIYQTKE